jgi:hypothetical protein
MRTSSLSNNQVIELLNSVYVPVHLRNQDFDGGTGEPEERREKDRIYRDALAAGLSAGTVCVYLVSPDGKPIATAPLNEQTAADPDKLLPLMRGVAKDLGAQPGPALTTPPRALSPRTDGSLALRIVTRYLERRDGQWVPSSDRTQLGTKAAIGWAGLPSDERVVLQRNQARKLLPNEAARQGVTWTPDPEAIGELLRRFYPPTENTDLGTNRIVSLSLRATVVEARNGVVRATIQGRFRMKHPFYHKDDTNHVEADLEGEIAFEPRSERVRSLTLVTRNGRYGGSVNGVQDFGAVAVAL